MNSSRTPKDNRSMGVPPVRCFENLMLETQPTKINRPLKPLDFLAFGYVYLSGLSKISFNRRPNSLGNRSIQVSSIKPTPAMSCKWT